MKKKNIDIEPVDIAVSQRSDFKTDQEWDVYLNANWPGVVIHNIFVGCVLLGKVISRLDELIFKSDVLQKTVDSFALDGYDDDEVGSAGDYLGH